MYQPAAKGSTTAKRRADQRRKQDTPDAWLPCPVCGRRAYLNPKSGNYLCMRLGCK